MARLQRRYGSQQVSAWESRSGRPLTWDAVRWAANREAAQQVVDRINARGARAEREWDQHQYRARLVTQVASDVEVVPDGQA